MNRPILSVSGLNSWYGESQALHDVDLVVSEGELVTILGRNGAGKTTILKSIMNLVPRQKGRIVFEDRDISGWRPDLVAQAGIGYCPEERGIFASLTVLENLMLPPAVGKRQMPLSRIYEIFPNLEQRPGSQGTKLSGGEQQMLAIARILRTGARLLLLDEPTEGLAPVIIKQIGRTIELLKAEGFTILLVEQNLVFANSIADRHYVIENGRVVATMPRARTSAERNDIGRYLGV